MKRITLLLAIVFACATITVTHAQLSKAEQKEWKKKAGALKKSPDELKALYDENAALKNEASGYKRQISSLEGDLKTKNTTINDLTEQIRRMEGEVSAARQQMQEAANKKPTGPVVDDSGVVFKVQIGAFRSKDLSKYFENNENFGGETDEEGMQKITLGRFRDYWEADTFKKYLREMGVKDAWIVPYKDGVRVAMKDVLEGVI